MANDGETTNNEWGRVADPVGVFTAYAEENGLSPVDTKVSDKKRRIALIAEIIQWKSDLSTNLQQNVSHMVKRLSSNDYAPPERVWVLMSALKRIEMSECARDVFCAMVLYLWTDISKKRNPLNTEDLKETTNSTKRQCLMAYYRACERDLGAAFRRERRSMGKIPFSREVMSRTKEECLAVYYRACERDLVAAVKRGMESLGNTTYLRYPALSTWVPEEAPFPVKTESLFLDQSESGVYNFRGTSEELAELIDANATAFLTPRRFHWIFPTGSYRGLIMRRWWVTDPLKLATNFVYGGWSFKKHLGTKIEARSGGHSKIIWLKIAETGLGITWTIDLETKTLELRKFENRETNECTVVTVSYTKLHPYSFIQWRDIAISHSDIQELLAIDLGLQVVKTLRFHNGGNDIDVENRLLEETLWRHHKMISDRMMEKKKQEVAMASALGVTLDE